MLIDFKSENYFKKTYFDVLKYRLSYGSLGIEEIKNKFDNPIEFANIFNQLDAVNYIFDNASDKPFKFYEFSQLLCGVAERINGFGIDGYRKTFALVNGSKIVRTKPEMIRNELMYLLDNYNYQISNAKSEDEIFEIEARFHIKLLHIHPFEDGNERTARIFLLYNLIKNNLAPVILTKELKSYYCDFIENDNYIELAKMFKMLSEKEMNNIINLYKDLDAKGLILSNKFPYELDRESVKKK